MTADPGLAERAAALRADAEAQLTALAGGASLCSIARSGAAFPGGKYQEGRASAAATLLRELRRGLEEAEALDAARSRWLAVAPERLRAAPDWRAYGEGGDDALAELAGPDAAQ
ncbi:hypothetical protein [Nocardioides sp. T2.26MG-1]|uniref:hypothetical protein n=1 Tax=Nocardioides sp. T2.26MG-1 TaxID=3041166 RepID=UPI0024774890|nr:hypothetical protein [Nocardioides sp. T2.26MG-1]CAI9407045.1 hypothetical protein HIDPHFAB_04708 [Nocardioides sp. T2.26MG-1]